MEMFKYYDETSDMTMTMTAMQEQPNNPGNSKLKREAYTSHFVSLNTPQNECDKDEEWNDTLVQQLSSAITL